MSLKKTINCIGISLLFLIVISCTKDDPFVPTVDNYFTGSYDCNKNDPNVIGARCRDGFLERDITKSTCSANGGVDSWLCK